MNKGTLIGLALLIGGFIIWTLYGLYLGFEEIMQALDLVTGLIGGLIIIGVIIMFISIIIDQTKRTNEMKSKIKKEDFEP